MKKTRALSTIAMVCFIFALVWQVINEAVNYYNAIKFGEGGSLIARLFFFGTLPTIAGIILLIIAAKKARTGVTPPQYKLGFFFLAGALLLNFIIGFIMAKGNMSGSIDYIIKVVFLIGAYLLVAFDSILLKPSKAMGIIGAAIIIAIAIIYASVYLVELTSSMPRNFYGSSRSLYGIMDVLNLLTILSYYTSIQFIGIGALLFAIGRQPKAQQPFVPHYSDDVKNGRNDDRFDNKPPQYPYQDQNYYQPPYQNDNQPPQQNDYQPPYNDGQ